MAQQRTPSVAGYNPLADFLNPIMKEIGDRQVTKVQTKKKAAALQGMGIPPQEAEKMAALPDNLLSIFLKQKFSGQQTGKDQFNLGSSVENQLRGQYRAEDKGLTEERGEDVQGARQATIDQARNSLANMGFSPEQALAGARESYGKNLEAGNIMSGAPEGEAGFFGGKGAPKGTKERMKNLGKVFSAVERGAYSKDAAAEKLIKSGWDKEEARKSVKGELTPTFMEFIKEKAGGDREKAAKLIKKYGFKL